MDESLAGRHLVSSPHLLDPNFYRTVIFIVEHGAEGAMGLVLNRPTDEPVNDHVPDWAASASEPGVVFIGGPVSNEYAVAIAENPVEVPETWHPALPGIGLIDLTAGPGATGHVARLRIFSGYSGWISGQLEAELETGSWFVVPAQPDDVFTKHPDRLWYDVLRRQPGREAFYALFPHDLRSN